MKKLLIAAAIVCAAGITQAASVSWGSTVGAVDDPYTASEGQVALLLYSTTQGALATTLNGIAVGSLADNGYTVVASHELNATEASFDVSKFEDAWGREDAAGGVNGYYQIVLVSEDGKSFDAVIPNMSEAITGIGDQTGAGVVKYNYDWELGYDKMLGVNGYTGTISAAPEPTSGLLLLLGVAGLALKRKRA